MNDLIRRDDVKRMINGKHLCVLDERILINALGDIPSAEPKVGRWIRDGHHIRCSECSEYICEKDREGDTIPQNFCPNCGAKMERSE
jgi:hypothetical protein